MGVGPAMGNFILMDEPSVIDSRWLIFFFLLLLPLRSGI